MPKISPALTSNETSRTLSLRLSMSNLSNGAPIVQYRFLPAEMPRGKSKANVRYLTIDDSARMAACYDRFYALHTGLLDEPETVWRLKHEFNTMNKYVGYVDDDGELRG